MAAEWGMSHAEALELADKLYVTGNIFKDAELLKSLPALPKSCVESARRLREKKAMYEREGIFPATVLDYVGSLLDQEHDENINQHLVDLPADDRLHETRKIMHKDLHRH